MAKLALGRRVELSASRNPGRAEKVPIGRPAPRGHPRCYIRPLFTFLWFAMARHRLLG